MNSLPEDPADRILMNGIHIELTGALQTTIRAKFGALIRHNPYIVRIQVHLEKAQKLGHEAMFRATGRMELRGPDIVAVESGKEAYGVLEALAGKLDHLLQRRHGLRKEKRNHPHEVELSAPIPKTGDVSPDKG
ncbi:MAG: HPF/RaiA family ribosome-associated protein [Opitutaceae bacterium]